MVLFSRASHKRNNRRRFMGRTPNRGLDRDSPVPAPHPARQQRLPENPESPLGRVLTATPISRNRVKFWPGIPTLCFFRVLRVRKEDGKVLLVEEVATGIKDFKSGHTKYLNLEYEDDTDFEKFILKASERERAK